MFIFCVKLCLIRLGNNIFLIVIDKLIKIVFINNVFILLKECILILIVNKIKEINSVNFMLKCWVNLGVKGDRNVKVSKGIVVIVFVKVLDIFKLLWIEVISGFIDVKGVLRLVLIRIMFIISNFILGFIFSFGCFSWFGVCGIFMVVIDFLYIILKFLKLSNIFIYCVDCYDSIYKFIK